MNKQFERYLKGTLLILDLVVLNVVYYFVQIAFNKSYTPEFIKAYNLYALVSNGLWLMITFALGLYNGKVVMQYSLFFKRTIQIFLLWVLILMVYLFFSREVLLSRLFILYATSLFGIGILFNRFLYLGFFQYYRSSDVFIKKVLVLGFNDRAQRLTKYLESGEQNIKLLGYTEDEQNIHQLSDYPVVGDIASTMVLAKKFRVQEIYSTLTPEDNEAIYQFMKEAERECIRFKIVPNMNSLLAYGTHLEFYGDMPVLSRRNDALDDTGNIIKKRMLDIVVSGIVIVFVLSWLVPLLGIFIYVESGFPILFKQKRTGVDNRPFLCLKFRSMKNNKDANLKQATENDSRVTRIGRFMRRTSLDEFPQFINVFKGDMSLVGPRPHMLKHTHDYSKIVDEYMVRQFVKPGITGWAQINGYRGEIRSVDDIRNRVEKDIWYIEHWTLWLDIQILFLTVYNIVKGDKNAY